LGNTKILEILCVLGGKVVFVHERAMPAEGQHDIIFYDGDCGLCHGLVRLILPRDKQAWFRFAPLHGETFTRMIPRNKRDTLPDSLVLRKTSGELLLRSSATLYVARRLGWSGKLAAAIFAIAPKAGRERLYDWVARKRKDWFTRPEAACPIVPESLRSRFLP
jgi:predicted DCC family thiol-disulfide oxidoreductase YuxK